MKALFTLLMMLAIQAAIGQTDSTNTISKPVEEDYDKVFTKVELEARFPGGVMTWRKYLERNLDASVAQKDHAPNGTYTVKVQFLVDKEGNLTDVKAIEVPKECPRCGVEAVKVLKKGPRWESAIQNGRHVKYLHTQSISFMVMYE